MSEKEYMGLTFDRIVKETDLAWLLDFGEKDVWVPKSVAEPEETLDGTKEIYLEKWFVEHEGLEDYEL